LFCGDVVAMSLANFPAFSSGVFFGFQVRFAIFMIQL
jgi:hypothetical protein